MEMATWMGGAARLPLSRSLARSPNSLRRSDTSAIWGRANMPGAALHQQGGAPVALSLCRFPSEVGTCRPACQDSQAAGWPHPTHLPGATGARFGEQPTKARVMRYRHSLRALLMALWFVSPPAFAQTGTNETGSRETGSKETAANKRTFFSPGSRPPRATSAIRRRSKTCLPKIVSDSRNSSSPIRCSLSCTNLAMRR
jgi:hypothetical protein